MSLTKEQIARLESIPGWAEFVAEDQKEDRDKLEARANHRIRGNTMPSPCGEQEEELTISKSIQKEES